MRTLAPSSPYVMPGTHCKWVQVDSQQINGFRTVVTGELRRLLLNHLLVGAGLPPQESAVGAFATGLEHSLNTPAVLPQLFKVRASHVLGTLPYEQVSEFLSGLLIGTEAASMRDYVDHQHAIILVAGTSLTVRYQQAFQAMDYGVIVVAGDAAFQVGIGSTAYAVAD